MDEYKKREEAETQRALSDVRLNVAKERLVASQCKKELAEEEYLQTKSQVLRLTYVSVLVFWLASIVPVTSLIWRWAF